MPPRTFHVLAPALRREADTYQRAAGIDLILVGVPRVQVMSALTDGWVCSTAAVRWFAVMWDRLGALT